MVLSLDVVPTGDIPTGASMLVGLLVCIVLMAVFGGVVLLLQRSDKARETPRTTERSWLPQFDFDGERAAARLRIREEWERASAQQPSTADSQTRKAERRRCDREGRRSSVLGSVESRLDRLLSDDLIRPHVLYEAYLRIGGYGTLGEFEHALDACAAKGLASVQRIRLNGRRGASRLKAYRRRSERAAQSFPPGY